jgi:ABC-2 type transport system permease protein
MDPGWTPGHTFVLDIPPNFQRDVLAGRSPAIQLNIDAMRRARPDRHRLHPEHRQRRGRAFVQRARPVRRSRSELVPRAMFNPNLERAGSARSTPSSTTSPCSSSCSPARR